MAPRGAHDNTEPVEVAGRKLVSLDDWHRRAAQGDKTGAPSGVLLRRMFTVRAKPVDGLDRTIEIVIGTSAQDRYRDVIETAGYETANYLLNPVVLWAHDYYSPPVGKAVAIFAEGEKLVARDQFCEPGLYPFADMVYRMLLAGYLSAASVGIDPLEWTYDEELGGVRFYRHELLEHSIVPVPANPEALARAKAAGIDLRPMDEWARKALDLSSGGELAVVSRASLEAVVKALGLGRGLKFYELDAVEIKAKVAARVRGESVDDPEAEEQPAATPPTEPAVEPAPQAEEDAAPTEPVPAGDEQPGVELSLKVDAPDLAALSRLIETALSDIAALRAEYEEWKAIRSEAAAEVARLAQEPAATPVTPEDIRALAERALPILLQPIRSAITATTGRVFEP